MLPAPQDSALLQLATASSGVLNLRRLGAVVVQHCVPLLATAAALVVAEDTGVLVTTAGPQGRQVRELAARRLPAAALAVLAGRGTVAHAADDATRAGVEQLTGRGAGERSLVVPLPLSADSTTALLVLDDPVTEPPEALAVLVAGHVDAAVRYGRRTRLATLLADAYRPRLGDVPGLDVASRYRPSREEEGIGGDFVDLVDRSGDSGPGDWTLVVGDVNGHGSDAAVVTGQVRQALRAAGQLARSPQRQLALADAVMQAERTSRFATAVVARLRTRGDGLRLTLARAGHPPALLVRRDGRVEVLHPAGSLLGALPRPRWEGLTRTVAAGDVLLLYTDGVTDARGPRGLFGLTRLVDSVRDFAGVPAEGVVAHVEERVVDFLAGAPHDDIALVAVRGAAATTNWSRR